MASQPPPFGSSPSSTAFSFNSSSSLFSSSSNPNSSMATTSNLFPGSSATKPFSFSLDSTFGSGFSLSSMTAAAPATSSATNPNIGGGSSSPLPGFGPSAASALSSAVGVSSPASSPFSTAQSVPASPFFGAGSSTSSSLSASSSGATTLSFGSVALSSAATAPLFSSFTPSSSVTSSSSTTGLLFSNPFSSSSTSLFSFGSAPSSSSSSNAATSLQTGLSLPPATNTIPSSAVTSDPAISFGGYTSQPSFGFSTIASTVNSAASSSPSFSMTGSAKPFSLSFGSSSSPAPLVSSAVATSSAISPASASTTYASATSFLSHASTSVTSTPSVPLFGALASSGMPSAPTEAAAVSSTVMTASTSSLPSFSVPSASAVSITSSVSTSFTFQPSLTHAFGSTASAPANISGSSSRTTHALSPATVAVDSGYTTSDSLATSQAPRLPSEVAGKTVEEIIKEWNSELQERTAKFRKHAAVVSDWDKKILHNRDVLIRLEAEVAKVVETQTSLVRQLELIETHQQEVDKALQSMEEEAERIYKEEQGLLLEDDAASTRDTMFDKAEFIEREMERMAEQIKSIIQTFNSKQGGGLDLSDSMTPIDASVHILNNQLSSLMWIDEKANEFSGRLQKLANRDTPLRDLSASRFWLN